MMVSRLLPVAALLVAACDNANAPERGLPLAPASSVSDAAAAGQLYTLNNATTGNQVLVFNRAADGSLTAAGSFATGGTGTGGGLGNQGILTFANRGRVLLAANAGSNQLSSFLVRGNGSLDLVGSVPSGGMQPISVAVSGSLVYVLNAGGSDNISGFTLSPKGALTPIANSTRSLSATGVGSAQVSFSPNGRNLVVTEKGTNNISIYAVQPNGTATGPTVVASNGMTPFGFSFRRGVLVVSEAFGGATDAGAVSSYELSANGSLQLISGSVPTTESAACWISITPDGRFVYTTNTASGTITGYSLVNGALSRLTADGVTAVVGVGTAPIDLTVTPDGGFVYSLNSGNESITGWSINADGSLSAVSGGITGLINGASGLVAR